ncbi:MAG: hypothetical protein KGM16_05265 [Bacteroidota bacterium]|nr:hypothetical protein [Bacteroidota bacterium]
MRKLFMLIVFITIITNHLLAQNLIGRWQENSPEVSAGYLNNYQFLNDSTFLFNTSEYFGLKRIINIGGKYMYDKNKKLLLLTVHFTNEIVGGHIERSKESGSASDAWVIEGGKIKKILLPKPVKAIIKIEFSNQSKGRNEIILLDKIKYYKVE